MYITADAGGIKQKYVERPEVFSTLVLIAGGWIVHGIAARLQVDEERCEAGGLYSDYDRIVGRLMYVLAAWRGVSL
jgi:hypothetical protein